MGENFLAVVRRGIEVVVVTECLTIHSRRGLAQPKTSKLLFRVPRSSSLGRGCATVGN
jgi:hypothetical protein